MRLIDADKLAYRYWDEIGCKCVLDQEIEDAPTVDAVPVVHAYWTPEYTETGVVAFGYKEETVQSLSCSNCGMKIDVSEGDFMYCPHCCATMDGKE